ncbi:hypothetical protein JS562_46335, partial [Agrobacterium sp. S2]|nr:hypothetical protein [Agrobacterium sp. S2]
SLCSEFDANGFFVRHIAHNRLCDFLRERPINVRAILTVAQKSNKCAGGHVLRAWVTPSHVLVFAGAIAFSYVFLITWRDETGTLRTARHMTDY